MSTLLRRERKKWYHIYGIVFRSQKGNAMATSTDDREKTSLSVRIPKRLKSRAVSVAQVQHVSFNAFVTDLIEKAVSETEQRTLYEAFSELGEDVAESDVEFALSAQAEVVLCD